MLWWTVRKLRSQDPRKRATALQELLSSDDPTAVDALLRHYEDCSDSNRDLTISDLAGIRNLDLRAVQTLIIRSQNSEVRRAAVNLLAEAKQPDTSMCL